MTVRRQRVLDVLIDYYRCNGVPPSQRILAWMVGVNLSTIHAHLIKLEKLGKVRKHRGMFIPVKGATDEGDTEH